MNVDDCFIFFTSAVLHLIKYFNFLQNCINIVLRAVMPRIDPAQLLKTLGVLLAPHGGIKSSEEVNTDHPVPHRNQTFYILGQQTRPVDAKVFQETCVQSYIREDIEVLVLRFN